MRGYSSTFSRAPVCGSKVTFMSFFLLKSDEDRVSVLPNCDNDKHSSANMVLLLYTLISAFPGRLYTSPSCFVLFFLPLSFVFLSLASASGVGAGTVFLLVISIYIGAPARSSLCSRPSLRENRPRSARSVSLSGIT